MPRERDANRKLFHKGHYEVIAARFREQASLFGTLPVDEDEHDWDTSAAASLNTLRGLADRLAERFAFDNSEFDRKIFLERCGFIQ